MPVLFFLPSFASFLPLCCLCLWVLPSFFLHLLLSVHLSFLLVFLSKVYLSNYLTISLRSEWKKKLNCLPNLSKMLYKSTVFLQPIYYSNLSIQPKRVFCPCFALSCLIVWYHLYICLLIFLPTAILESVNSFGNERVAVDMCMKKFKGVQLSVFCVTWRSGEAR